MWENFLNSEITFWFLVTADVVMICGIMIGYVWYLRYEKEHKRRVAEREAYLRQSLNSIKN